MPPSPLPKPELFKMPQVFALALHKQGHLTDNDTIAGTIDDYIAIATRLGLDSEFRQAISSRMAENKHKLYRDRAPVTALEDFLESAVRG